MFSRFNGVVAGAIATVLCGGFLSACKNDEQAVTETSAPRDVVVVTPAASPQTTVFIATTAEDYSSSAISTVRNASPFQATNAISPTISDADIFANGNFLYRVERSTNDSIAKFDASTFSSNSTPLWQFATRDGSEASSNVHDMVFVSPTKAYLLRYAQKTAWIVNPSATTEAGFKSDNTLDLSDYADSDGSPEMDHGVVVNGKLFVVLQRLASWVPGDAYVAVFDTVSDTEIDTGTNSNHKGILLPVRDPLSIQYNAETSKIYVSAIGSYGDVNTPYSGLVEIDPTSYAVRTILNPSSPVSGSPGYKRISNTVVISATKGYFTDYAGWKDNSLYTFNPTTGLVDSSPVGGLLHKNLANLAFNATSGLWVGNHTDHGVNIIDPTTNTVTASVNTVLNPGTILFVDK